MAKIFTPIQAIASAGLIKDRGLAIPQTTTTAVSDFNSLDIPSAVSALLASGPGSDVIEALKSLPGCLTGMATQDLIDSVPVELAQDFDFGNVMSDVVAQSQAIFSNGTRGLTDILPSVHSFCINSFNLLGTFRVMQDKLYDDFGLTIGNYNDIMTGGVSSQFDDVLQGIDSQGFLDLMDQIGNFGTMFDINQLSRINDARTLCQNLLNQGFYQVSDALLSKQIDTADLLDTNPALVVDALKSVTGIDLLNIVSVTKFRSHRILFSLADVLDAEKIFSPEALSAAGGSLDSLSEKLSNIGGSFDSFADLKNTYLSIRKIPVPNLSNLPTLSGLGSGNIFNDDFSDLGRGSGTYDNPTVYDVIGSLSGTDYIEKINQLIEFYQSIATSVEIQNILSSINSADAAGITNAKDQLESSNLNTSVQQTEMIFKGVFNNLLNERFNLHVAGISLDESVGNMQGLSSFVLDLHQIYQDPMGLRYRELIESLVTQDVYGESILAAIAEGNNIALLNEKGVPSYTGLDPIDFRMRLMEKPC